MTVDDSHEFGSDEITEVKLALVEQYLKAYSTALSGKFKLWYIDAFAGTGSRDVRHAAVEPGAFFEGSPAWVERRRGSAKIALDIKPAFDRLIFMEQRAGYYDALVGLAKQYPDRDVTVVRGDANQLIREAVSASNWRNTRAVLFLDPYGMNVAWSTLEAIAATKAIDVWYLFSIEGLFRNAARDINNVDVHKRAALTRMLGTDEWENDLYQTVPDLQVSLFDETSVEERRRFADVRGLEAYVTKRLRSLFPLVLEPYPLPVIKRPQRFSLYCAIANNSGPAVALAQRIGKAVLKAGNSSQVRPM